MAGPFSEASIQDFYSRLTSIRREAMQNAALEAAATEAEMARRQMLRSSIRIQRQLQTMDAAFKAVVETMLDELRHAIKATNLDPHEMRRMVEIELDNCRAELPDIAKVRKAFAAMSSSSANAADPAIAAMESFQAERLRSFDVGLDRPKKQPGSVVYDNSQSISARDISAPVVQGQQSTINVSVAIDVSAAFDAISVLELEADRSGESAEVEDFRADLATIKTQLRKSSPSRGVLREAFSSVRNVIEGAAGGIIASPPGMAALAALGTALGF